MDTFNTSCVQIVYAVLDLRRLSQIECHSLMEKMIGETMRMAKEKSFEAVIFTTFDFFVTVGYIRVHALQM
jgi:hypothetical protein